MPPSAPIFESFISPTMSITMCTTTTSSDDACTIIIIRQRRGFVPRYVTSVVDIRFRRYSGRCALSKQRMWAPGRGSVVGSEIGPMAREAGRFGDGSWSASRRHLIFFFGTKRLTARSRARELARALAGQLCCIMCMQGLWCFEMFVCCRQRVSERAWIPALPTISSHASFAPRRAFLTMAVRLADQVRSNQLQGRL